MFGLGSREIIIIAVILVLLFGAKKIPELAKGIGDAIKLIRGGFKEDLVEEKQSNESVSKKK